MELQDLINCYCHSRERTRGLLNQIEKFEDGFIYLAELCIARGHRIEHYQLPNDFVVQQWSDKYWDSDEAILSVYTNNPAHRLGGYDRVYVISSDYIDRMREEWAKGEPDMQVRLTWRRPAPPRVKTTNKKL